MRKDANIDHYAVIGQTTSHSLSPYIHQRFAEFTHQKIHYHALDSSSEDFAHDLREFLYYGKGMNITAPFKELAFKIAHEVSEAASLAQAANTLSKQEDNTIRADNTDGIGFIRDLTINQGFDPRNKSILIIGAGGAARGILSTLINENPKHLIITNRSYTKAKTLADYFKVEALALEKIAGLSIDLIVQASSVMPELPAGFLAQNAFCYDLNYGKKASDFRRWVKQQQLRHIDGTGMLVEQAAESFYLWRGIKPETQELITELHKSRE